MELPSLVHPGTRGRLLITGQSRPTRLRSAADTFSDPVVKLYGKIGNSLAMCPFVKREAMPGNLGNLAGSARENFLRDAASTVHHQTCTAKMGGYKTSLVADQLKVCGVDKLSIAQPSR